MSDAVEITAAWALPIVSEDLGEAGVVITLVSPDGIQAQFKLDVTASIPLYVTMYSALQAVKAALPMPDPPGITAPDNLEGLGE